MVKRLLVDALRRNLNHNGVRVDGVGSNSSIKIVRDPLTNRIVSWISPKFDPSRQRAVMKFRGEKIPRRDAAGRMLPIYSYNVVQIQTTQPFPVPCKFYISMEIVDTGLPNTQQDRTKQQLEVWNPSFNLVDCIAAHANAIAMRVLLHNLVPPPQKEQWYRIDRLFVHVDRELQFLDACGKSVYYTYHWSVDGIANGVTKD